jgi:hypothetical protein
MPLVHVVFTDLETECLQQAHPSHPQHHFLLEPVGLVTAVQTVGDGTVLNRILVEIGVQK